MNNKSKYSLSLIIGIISLIIIFANCFIASAENSSQINIKESSEQTGKPVIRPSRKKGETRYNVEVRPVKVIKPKTQNEAPANRMHGTSPLSGEDSKFKTDIKIYPIKKTPPTAPENSDSRTRHRIKSGEDTNRNESEQMDNIKGTVSVPMPIDRPEKGDRKFEVQTGPIKAIESENAQTRQPPPGEKIKVTRIRAWKLDESGNKTDEAIIDDNNVIKGMNQPSSDLNK
jgi:hypothetical protein